MSDHPTDSQNEAAPPLDLAKYAKGYVAVRDKIAEIGERHEAELAPYKEMLRKIEGVVLPHLQATRQDSAKTSEGTFSALPKYSASAEDPEAFRTYVTENGEFDLCDMKPNVKEVQEYLKKNQCLPPGVKLNAVVILGCRRPTKKAE